MSNNCNCELPPAAKSDLSGEMLKQLSCDSPNDSVLVHAPVVASQNLILWSYPPVANITGVYAMGPRATKA